MRDLTKMTNIEDLRVVCKRNVPKMFYEYVDTGSWTQATYRENVSDFNPIKFKQRILVDMDNRTLETTLLGQKVKFHLYSRLKNFILGVLLIFIFYITTFWFTMMSFTYFLCPEDDRRYCMEITQFVVFGYTMYGVGKWLFVFVALLLGSLLVMTSNKFLKKNTDNS